MMSCSLSSLLALTVFVTCDCRNLMSRDQSFSMSDALYQTTMQDQEYSIWMTLLTVQQVLLWAMVSPAWYPRQHLLLSRQCSKAHRLNLLLNQAPPVRRHQRWFRKLGQQSNLP